MAAEGFVKALEEILEVGVFWTGVTSDGAGLGEFVDFFWKKPRIDFWPFPDWETEEGCFFWDGRGVDISFPSTPRAILLVLWQVLRRAMATAVRWRYPCDYRTLGR